MFRSTARNLRTWWIDFSDDILGADLAPAVYEEELDYHLSHPHRRLLGAPRVRRDGQVPARPTDCLCPIRIQTRTAAAAPSATATSSAPGR